MRHCPALVRNLQHLWNTSQELQDWLFQIRKDLPDVLDGQIAEAIRAKFLYPYPIVASLTLEQLIAVEAEFGHLGRFAEELKRRYDPNYFLRIPNLYGITADSWETLCKEGFKDVQYSLKGDFEYISIPVREAPTLFGYRVRFGHKLCLSYGYKTTGTRMTDGELIRLKIRLKHVGIGLTTGELIETESGEPQNPDEVFEGVQKGDLGEVPEDIQRIEAGQKRKADKRAAQKSRAKCKRKARKQRKNSAG